MSKTAETETKSAALKDDVDLLKEDIVKLRKDLQSIFADLKGYASTQAREGLVKGEAIAHDAGEHLEAARDDLQRKIREKPLAAVGIAFGAGLLLALLNRK